MKKVILVILAVLLTGCMGYRIQDATARDTLFSVEQSGNGAYRIWLTHDDVSGYCTYDKDMGERALDILENHNGEVVITFRSINETDPEWSLWNSSDCKTTEATDAKMWLLKSIESVQSR